MEMLLASVVLMATLLVARHMPMAVVCRVRATSTVRFCFGLARPILTHSVPSQWCAKLPTVESVVTVQFFSCLLRTFALQGLVLLAHW